MTEEEKLKKFIYDNKVQEQLRDISNSLKTYNIFDIVGMGEQEIKHSNFLGWLFELKIDGHGYVFLEEFLRGCIEKHEDSKLKEYVYLSPKTSIKVFREYQNIDLVIEDKINKILIVIENKINASEDKGDESKDGQLEKYKKIVDNHLAWKYWKEENKFFYFLSPDGILASGENPKIWKAIDYGVIAKPLEKILKNIKNDKISINPDFSLLIDHYLDLLYRKGIVMSQDVKELCDKIWGNPEKVAALRIIFANKPGLDNFKQDLKTRIISDFPSSYFIDYTKTDSDFAICTKNVQKYFNLPSDNKSGKIELPIRFGLYIVPSNIYIWVIYNESQEYSSLFEKIKQTLGKIKNKKRIDIYSEELDINKDELFIEEIRQSAIDKIIARLKQIDNCFLEHCNNQ
jgi:hypothetical protein